MFVKMRVHVSRALSQRWVHRDLSFLSPSTSLHPSLPQEGLFL